MVLHKDVVILLFKVVHRYRLMRCNGEYSKTYYTDFKYMLRYRTNSSIMFNWRVFELCNEHVCKGMKFVCVLPKRYNYSSGFSNPKAYK